MMVPVVVAVVVLFHWKQLKAGGYKTVAFYFSGHFSFADCRAKSVRGMRIAMFVDVGSVYEIGFTVNANCQITTAFAFHPELALAAGSLYNLCFRFLLCIN